MENNEPPKKKHALDKILMGAVIGGAIGSVIGATIAPKKGKETRKEIIETVKNTGKNSKKFFQKLKEFFSFKKKRETETGHERSSIKKIPTEEIAKAKTPDRE
ncbi:YtxH domain-containing protein [Candidatus Peregrinibacteria bacterium]|nr:YtxH domain-containing protein [Candidatus Peregrinibacteria bacterium]